MPTFNDIKSDLEATIVEPLQALRQKIAAINGYHNQCLKQCQDGISALVNGTDGQPTFQGPSAKALSDYVTNYLSAARVISGTDVNDPYGTSLDGYMQKPVNIGEDIAHKLWISLESINGAIQIVSTNSGIPTDGGLPTPSTVGGTTIAADDAAGGFVLTLDTGAALQGGLDIPWDAIALVATAGYLIYKIATTNPDQAKIDLANAYAAEAKQLYDQQITAYKNTEPLGRLPDSPKGPKGDFGKFLLLIGIVVTASGAVVFLNQLPVDPKKQISQLTPEDLDKLKTYLMNVYGCSSAQIDKILQQVQDKNPTAGQVENLIKALKIVWQLQTLQQELQNSKYPNANHFLNENVNGDLDRILRDINNGNWVKWTDTNIRGWQDNANSATYQYQVAQALKARDIESIPPSIGADVTSGDNIWYELKNSVVKEGDNNYSSLVSQLKAYLDEQPDNGRGVGVVVNPGSDRNLAAELLASLKSAYGDDPKIKWLKNIDVKFIPYNPPNPPSNRWCRM
ncbi:MAG TPA: hypothetical protein VKY19_26185 [Ktedonosporobacter sp.]|jgi:hypothetical protein|nr:hypothetical protein [Ktedonosporobacter sp.]